MLVLDFVKGEHRLQALLNHLLNVEPEHVVGYVVVIEQPLEDDLVSFGLSHEQESELVRLKTGQ